MRDAGCGMRDAGCGMRGEGCGMWDGSCAVRDEGCAVRDAAHVPDKIAQPLGYHCHELRAWSKCSRKCTVSAASKCIK
jgi:hypothetical protein